MSSSAIVAPFLSHNRSVKAWCFTTNHSEGSVASPAQTVFDTKNFIDGYNLRLDSATQIGGSSTGVFGALRFSFITPMQDTRYKVFVSVYGSTSPLYPMMAHALNSSVYPKTRNSFWIRVGYFSSTGTPAQAGAARLNNQLTNRALWENATTNLGVVVL
jgi:hypothetical protein